MASAAKRSRKSKSSRAIRPGRDGAINAPGIIFQILSRPKKQCVVLTRVYLSAHVTARYRCTPPTSGDVSRRGSPRASPSAPRLSKVSLMSRMTFEDEEYDDEPSTSSADSEEVVVPRRHTPTPTKKKCTCCQTDTTPLWRDIPSRPNRSGQSLCNACGIRFKKYDMMCHHCSYVPTKQEHVRDLCARCHEPYGPQRAPT
eukprot:m.199376 g.199376  ORF g.199376 m.199376 type:complete len:200 (+) comp25170_c1_seq1:654-1253(+)